MRSAGTSIAAHQAGLERVVQAGGQPISWVALACDLQRDWNRPETGADITQIVITERLSKEIGGRNRGEWGVRPINWEPHRAIGTSS
jgi:hypothetical protein